MPYARDSKNFYRVRQRPPKRFTRFTMPAWGARVAGSHVKGAKVVTGRTRAGKWEIQSVLIPKKPGMSREKAVKSARGIRNSIEGKKR